MIFTPLVIAVPHSATPAEAITLVDAITYSTNLRIGNHVCIRYRPTFVAYQDAPAYLAGRSFQLVEQPPPSPPSPSPAI
jgi:hypothetical protein